MNLGSSLLGQNLPNDCMLSNIQLDREPSLRDPDFTFSTTIASAARRQFGDDVSLCPASMTFQFDLDTTGTIQRTEFCKPQDLDPRLMNDIREQLKGQQIFTPAMRGGKAIPYQLTFRIACLLWRK